MPADCAFHRYLTRVFDPRREDPEVLGITKLGSRPVNVGKDPACSADVKKYVERYYDRDLAKRRSLLIKPACPRAYGRKDPAAIYCGKWCVVVDKQIVPRRRPEVW